MDYFAPWDWIVSVSSYREEFSSLIDIEDFRSSVEAFRLGKSGYAFILNGDGEMIIHPWLEGDVSKSADADGAAVFKKMMSLRNGQFYYSWMDPDKNEPRQKLMVFRSLPEFDWVVASASYLDEVYAPLDR